MGIGDLFNKNKEETAINNINNKSNIIMEAMMAYYSRPDFVQKRRWDDSDIIPYIKGDLLRTYLNLVKNKNNEAKTFFKDDWFYQNSLNTVQKIYELDRQINSINRKQPEIAERAQESLNDIYDYALYFMNNQRRR